MLRNISNFYNIIKRNRIKTSLKGGDLISVGVRDAKNKSTYYDSAIKFSDLQSQVGGGGGTGPQGPAGADGQAATIQVGTTTTGATGTAASVTNTGDSTNAVFNFTIPEGVQGPAGPAGPVGAAGLNFVGTWSSGTAYNPNDVVFYNGSSYVAANAVGPTATPPDVDTANWDFLALQGLDGPQGPQGPQGLTGPQGPSLWGPVSGVNITGVYNLDLTGFNTFRLTATGNTTLDVINPSIGEYTFIINNTAAHTVTLQTGSIFRTNNSLQPVISGVTFMKGFYDGTNMYITSLENMTNV